MMTKKNNMDSLEKSKLALRKHILENKEQVLLDLQDMRDKTKWSWMMDYCKDNNIPPAQTWAWNKAELAHKNYINNI